ncbi:hypothetical protein C9321_16890 [Escherichia coli]|nr:hypothetical protein [Escherichia coli]EFI8922214.1 hypothetical protein [Escherichia coli]TJA06631.1 hypothetical protein C9321_16890 [Escherichia coli]TJQ93433.1 hypothetical protein C9Z52_17045 [Escherichia coli]TJS43056.1 hypothetical protein C9Z19_16165 [Escherichia coli]
MGRDRRVAISEAFTPTLSFSAKSGHESLLDRVKGTDSITLHTWLDRYETILS